MILSAAPDDLNRCPEYRVLLEDSRVTLDASSFEEKFAALHEAQLVVAVDTALAHLAIVAGAPTVCIGSAAYINWAIPYDSRMVVPHARFVVMPIDCAGCLGSCHHPLEDGRFRCVLHPARRVVDELEDLTRQMQLCA